MKRPRNLFATRLLFGLLAMLTTMTAWADGDVVASGYCGDPEVNEGQDVYYRITGTGSEKTLSFEGTGGGVMYDYASFSQPWKDYQDEIKYVVIDNGVTRIGDCAFSGFSVLETVTVGSGVTSIGTEVFFGNSKLTSITVDAGNEHFKAVGGVLFSYDGTVLYCYPAGLTATEYAIPDGVTTIGTYAFRGAYTLANITIPDGVSMLGRQAFYGTAFYNNLVPDEYGVLYVHNMVCDCELYSGDFSVIIAPGTTAIAEGAFSGCAGLSSITIPASVTNIGQNAFSGCSNLSDVYCQADPTTLTWDDGDCNDFKANRQTLCHVENAVDWSSFVDKVNVTFVGGYCGVPNENDGKNLRWDVTFNDDNERTLTIFKNLNVEGNDFYIRDDMEFGDDNRGSKNVIIEDGVRGIGAYSFKFFQMECITIPSSVTRINNNSFDGCSYLKTVVVLAGTPPTLGAHAFQDINHDAVFIVRNSAYETAEGWQDLKEHTGEYANYNFTMSVPTDNSFNVVYIDMNGQQTTCPYATPLTGSETTLTDGWYVVNGTVNFDHHIRVEGNVRIILKDQAVMNVGTAQNPIDGVGIGDGGINASISIYGQSTGADNGQFNVYATSHAIWAFSGGFNCSSARVTVQSSTTGGYGIWAYQSNIRLRNATINATGKLGLFAQNGNVTINGGRVTATGGSGNSDNGIQATQESSSSTGNVIINGGQVTANGGGCGIYVGGGNITLGWMKASDFVYASKYGTTYYGSPLNLVSGKSFIDGGGHVYSGYVYPSYDVIPINGQTIYPYLDGAVDYMDKDGLRQFCTEFTTLIGSETTLTDGWYVADGTVSFDHAVSATGNATIILKDNAMMNIGTAQSPVSGNGFGVNNSDANITIYGQRLNSGHLNVYATNNGLYAEGGQMTIVGGQVKASSYSGNIAIAEGKSYITDDGTILSSGIISSEQLTLIDGQTLYPYVEGAVFYLDMNGQRQFCASCTALTGSETTLTDGWYVVDGTVNFDHHIDAAGNVCIILKDRAVMNVGTAQSPISGHGIGRDNNNGSISIYGQSTGADNGQLNVYATSNAIWAFNGNFNCSSAGITAQSTDSNNGIFAICNGVSGAGNISLKDATIDAAGSMGLFAQGGDVTINGGQVTANGSSYGIFSTRQNSGGNVTINGGQVTANGSYGIYAYGGLVTLGWIKPSDFISANKYNAANAVLNLVSGKSFIDGEGNIYTNAIERVQGDFPVNKTYYPYVETLTQTANQVENLYWTTFYCGHTNYAIEADENACAYTAEYDAEHTQLTLHRLGKEIPKQTAVVIVGEDDEISMTQVEDNANLNVPANNLRGVDMPTATSALGDGTFYVLANPNSNFGFHRYTGTTMPARKAYLQLDAAPGARLTVVFGEEATGIVAIDNGQLTIDNDYYDLSGRKLSGKPTKKGVYIVNGVKVVKE